jgi:hypothetical protein
MVINTSVVLTASRASEVFSFMQGFIAYHLHRCCVLSNFTKNEQAALATTFTSPDVYVGQHHHVMVAPDIWYFPPPKTTQWIQDLMLTSYTASLVVRMFADYVTYKVPTIAWLTGR